MSIAWAKSGFVERDDNDIRAGGAKAFFFLGGTTTPLAVHEDAGGATPHAHPVVADANGRWPAIFIPFTTSYDIQVTTSDLTQLYYHEEIPNPDPVEAGEETVDATELIATGHVHWEPIKATKTGYVRLNGTTIGSAVSGATERASNDCEDLFLYLWNALANAQAPVLPSRGATASADWAANRTITLLDGRGGTLNGLDDMGSSSAGRFASTPFVNGNGDTAGARVGENTHVLITAELAQHLHAVSITSGAGTAHTHSLNSISTGAGTNHSHPLSSNGSAVSDGAHTHPLGGSSGGQSVTHAHTYDDATNLTNLFISDDDGNGTISNVWNGTSTSNTGNASVDHTHTLSAGSATSNGAHTHNLTGTTDNESAHTHPLSGNVGNESAHTHLVSGNTNNQGSGTAHNVVSFGLLGTFFIKL